MAIPGKPGTLSRRLKSLGRGARVMAKTGTLDEVVGLAEAPNAFVDLLSGGNVGTRIVRLDQ